MLMEDILGVEGLTKTFGGLVALDEATAMRPLIGRLTEFTRLV